MRIVPDEIQEILDARINVQLLFVVKITWYDDEQEETHWYSTKEFDNVNAYVQEFGSFDQALTNQGGVSNVLEVTFVDYYGHFKHMLDQYDPFDKRLKAEVFFTVEGATDHLVPIFNGVLRGNVVWNEEATNLTVEIDDIQEDEDPLLFEPERSELPEGMLRENIEVHPWPLVIGGVFKAPTRRLAQTPRTYVRGPGYTDPTGLSFAGWTSPDEPGTNTPITVPVRTEDPFPFPVGPTLPISMIFKGETFFNIFVQGIFGYDDASDTYTFTFDPGTANPLWFETPMDVSAVGSASQGILQTDWSPPPHLEHLFVKAQDTEGETHYTKVARQIGNTYQITRDLGVESPIEFQQILAAAKAPWYKRIHRIPEDTELRLANWDYSNIYILGTSDVVVQNLWVGTSDGYKWIPEDFYTVHRPVFPGYTYLWPGAPACTYVKVHFQALNMFFEQEAAEGFDGFGEQILFDGYTSGPLLSSIKSGYQYKVDGPEPEGDPPIPLAFSMIDQQDKHEFLTDVVWQHGATHRIKPPNIFEMKYLFMEDQPIRYSFNDTNVQENSIEITTTPFTNIDTIVDVAIEQRDYSLPLIDYRLKNNTERYGDRFNEYDFYALRDVLHSRQIANWWFWNRSKAWWVLRFNTFLPALKLEPYDFVELNFSDLKFYDVSKGTPLENHASLPTEATSSLTDGTIVGFIRDLSYDLPNGLINVEVQLGGFGYEF